MLFEDMQRAVYDAERTIRKANNQSLRLAQMLRGKLRIVSKEYDGDEVLKDLKIELSQFNASTGKWKN